MKIGIWVLLAGVLLGAAGFTGVYYLGTSSCRELMSADQPELAWLRKEFKLSETEFARMSDLHAAYLPRCAARCSQIEQQNRKLEQLFGASPPAMAEIRNALLERARMRANCEAEMMEHFIQVSQQMPAEQGKRYLAWIGKQTFLRGQAMEDRHRTNPARHSGHNHSM